MLFISIAWLQMRPVFNHAKVMLFELMSSVTTQVICS